MTEGEDMVLGRVSWGRFDEHSPYTREAQARVQLSAEARELSDFARAFVAIHGRADSGLVEDAARLRYQAELVLRYAVIAARAANTSWEDIGDALGVKRQSAHERYAEAERHWQEVLANPEAVNESGERHSRAPFAAMNPAKAGAELNEWVRRHHEPTDGTLRDAPVSAGLRRMDPLTELLSLSDRRRILLAAQPPPDQLAAI